MPRNSCITKINSSNPMVEGSNPPWRTQYENIEQISRSNSILHYEKEYMPRNSCITKINSSNPMVEGSNPPWRTRRLEKALSSSIGRVFFLLRGGEWSRRATRFPRSIRPFVKWWRNIAKAVFLCFQTHSPILLKRITMGLSCL